MAGSITIAVDVMGGDYGPQTTVPALAKSLLLHPDLDAIIFGDADRVQSFLDKIPIKLKQRVALHHCTQQVEDSDKPSLVLRKKQDSSMWQAISAVKDGRAVACVSAGNTGALVAMGKIQLNTLPNIDRPAICTAIPTLKGRSYLMDMGASVHCDAEQLHQFALLGTALVKILEGIDRPSVRLLNIGAESGKGTATLQQAASYLQQDKSINYQGFVEGDGIFQGGTDVIICDGFVGNVALKTGEGLAKMVANMLREAVKDTWVSRIAAWLMRSSLRKLSKRLNPSQYNGASLLGLNGILVKSHGSASENGFFQAIEVAYKEAKQNLPQLMLPLLAEYVAHDRQIN